MSKNKASGIVMLQIGFHIERKTQALIGLSKGFTSSNVNRKTARMKWCIEYKGKLLHAAKPGSKSTYLKKHTLDDPYQRKTIFIWLGNCKITIRLHKITIRLHGYHKHRST